MLTFPGGYDIIIPVAKQNSNLAKASCEFSPGVGPAAGVAELADAQDLKSCGTYTPVPVRSRSPAFRAQIAQSVEQRTENPRVTGSIPVLGT